MTLITPTGHYNQIAIAARVAELWNAKREFLSGYSGTPLHWWRQQIWSDCLDRAFHEASQQQSDWFLKNVRVILTADERAELDRLRAQQQRLPIYDHEAFRSIHWTMLEIENGARKRAYDATGIARDRAAALAAAIDPVNAAA